MTPGAYGDVLVRHFASRQCSRELWATGTETVSLKVIRPCGWLMPALFRVRPAASFGRARAVS